MTSLNASVLKAMEILRLIARDGPVLTLAEMASRLKMSRAAVHRLVTTLEHTGAVIRLRRNQYVLGLSLRQLVRTGDDASTLSSVVRPVARRLMRLLGEVVHLGTFDGDMVTYLVKEAPRRKSMVPTAEGTQLEAYSSGIGKVLLAHLPAEALERYLSDAPFIPLTERTITDPDTMRVALYHIRAQGYAMDDEEAVPGLTCLAVPILNPMGGAIAALSVSAPTARFDSDVKGKALSMLQDEARVLTGKLFGGGHGFRAFRVQHGGP